ncbi:hypothetical protein LX32DRAFT_578528 [Colletotrichum zoysiae]|uniref:Uncharacterized protein n=1 Tax=Colletotrichum zoysiae TaxID=1216348 RepID=A0AAD9HUW0_9PEZI|nr:hypothetical protein LX32DRAFT_578528 [Colletotrichum zoysiae]
MAPQPCRNGTTNKTTMTTKYNARIQGTTGVQKTTASKGAKNKKTPNVESEDKFDTFHPFGTKLPRELVAMIVEEAADCGPAIVYAECRVNINNSLSLVLVNGKEGSASKYKELVRLAKLLPDFRAIIERRFGLRLNGFAAKHPIMGTRRRKDLLVFTFEQGDGRGIQFFHWITTALFRTNRAGLAPGVRNVGIHFNHDTCNGISVCYGCTSCVRSIMKKTSCGWELAALCQNLCANNIFVLVLLRGQDVDGTRLDKHANLMKTLIADCKAIPGHVSFEDAHRTWVEVSQQTPRAHLDLMDRSVLRPILDLCVEAQSINTNQVSRMIGPQARPNVRFRLLVGSRWKNATLKI